MRLMFKAGLLLCAVYLLFLFLAMPTQASPSLEPATCAEAKVLTEKAVVYLTKHGLKEAYGAFHDKMGQFRDRDLYIFVINRQHINVVHPITPRLQYRNVDALKDVLGRSLGLDIVSIQDKGWIHYKYPDPFGGSVPKDKSSYIINTGRYWVGCGCYKLNYS